MRKAKKRPVLKINLYNKNIDLYIDMIRTMDPTRKTMILHPHEYYLPICDDPKCPLIKYGMQVTIYNDQLYNRIKFEYVRYLKTLPDPEDRVADYEWRTEEGLPDFDKLERLIEKRKTAEEKRKELMEELEIKKACERFGIEYFGPLRED